MSKENYLTLYKENYDFFLKRNYQDSASSISAYSDHENEITYLITEENADQIFRGINNGHKIAAIDVNEPFKNGKKVIRRTIDLSKFKSLNIVESADKTIKIRRLLIAGNSFLDSLIESGMANKNETLDNLSKDFSLSVHYTLSANEIEITSYSGCKILEYTLGPIKVENRVVSEHVLMSYESYEVHKSQSKVSKEILPIHDTDIIGTSVMPKGRKIVSADFISIYFGNYALGMVQELEINSKFKVVAGK